MFRAQRPHQHGHRGGIRCRQMPGEGAGDVPAPIEELEGIETGAGLRDKSARGKRRVDARNISGESPDESRREKGFELLAHDTAV
jgi:hypothetical protein